MKAGKTLIPGKLYQYRKDIEVDTFMFHMTAEGNCQGPEFEVSPEVVVMFLRDYEQVPAQWGMTPEYGVFLAGEQIGVSRKEYFKRMKS